MARAGTARSNSQRTNSYIGKGIIAPGGGGGKVFRAIGQNTYGTIGGFGIGASNRSQRLRSMHRSRARFAEISIVYQVYEPKQVSSVITDTKFAAPIGFQAGFEINPVQALTGLAPRTPFLWAGANFKRYDPSGWDPNVWLIETDVLNIGDLFGRYIEADEIFGIHSGQTLDAVDTGGVMPRQRPLSNYLQRYTGAATLATSLIDTGELFSLSSYTDAGSSRLGNLAGLGPLMMMPKVPKTFVSMFVTGDSITQDQKVGYGSAPALFDVQGDAEGNSSWYTMGAKRLGVGAVNGSRGSDGDKNLQNPANWLGRQAAMKRSNATCYDNTNGMNDTAAATQNPTSWAAGATLTKGQVVPVSGSRFYLVLATGAAGATAPTGTTIGAPITDGAATIAYLGPRHADSRDKAYTVFAWKASVNAQVRAAMPLIWIRNMMPLLKATSTDNFATAGNQAPATDYGANSSRTKMRELMQEPLLRAILGADEVYDVSGGIETAAGSGVMQTSGTAGYVMDADGTHPLDQGHVNMAALLPAPPPVSAAQLAA